MRTIKVGDTVCLIAATTEVSKSALSNDELYGCALGEIGTVENIEDGDAFVRMPGGTWWLTLEDLRVTP